MLSEFDTAWPVVLTQACDIKQTNSNNSIRRVTLNMSCFCHSKLMAWLAGNEFFSEEMSKEANPYSSKHGRIRAASWSGPKNSWRSLPWPSKPKTTRARGEQSNSLQISQALGSDGQFTSQRKGWRTLSIASAALCTFRVVKLASKEQQKRWRTKEATTSPEQVGARMKLAGRSPEGGSSR